MIGLTVVQARLGSTRFPRKILADLAGKPVLTWVVERALQMGLPVVVACPRTDVHEIRGAVPPPAWVWGSGRAENDVLGRFADVITAHRPLDCLVRLTADSPFLDPAVARDHVTIFRSGRLSGIDMRTGRRWTSTYHYLANCFPPPACADGGLDVEVVDPIQLLQANLEAEDPQDREHATRYLWRQPDRYACAQVPIPDGYGALGIRWMIDTLDDYDRLLPLAKRLRDEPDTSYARTQQLERLG